MAEQSQTQTAVLLKAPGGPDQLYLGTAPKPRVQEKPDHILIRVRATAINRADTLQREGKYPAPKGESDILGLEAAGEVEDIGANVKNFKKGDRVMALLGGGGYAQYVAVHKGSVMPIPVDFSFEQAAAIPETWLTAFQLLHLVGEVQAGDYVLIHAGASGVGTAAIQLALLAGAKPIVTVSSPEKMEYCKNLGAVACINYKSTPQWADEVLAATEKNGINVILDCIGESYAQLNSKVIALDGRWVLYGLMGGGVVPQFSFREMLSKRVSLRATTLRTRSTDYKTALVQAFTEKALPHFAGGRFKVVVDEVFEAAAIGAAHSKMEKNANMGKIVVRMP